MHTYLSCVWSCHRVHIEKALFSHIHIFFEKYRSLFQIYKFLITYTYVFTFRLMRWQSLSFTCTGLFRYVGFFSDIYVSFDIYSSLFRYISLFCDQAVQKYIEIGLFQMHLSFQMYRSFFRCVGFLSGEQVSFDISRSLFRYIGLFWDT